MKLLLAYPKSVIRDQGYFVELETQDPISQGLPWTRDPRTLSYVRPETLKPGTLK